MSVLVAENLNLTNKNKPSITNFSYNFLDNKIYAILGKSDSGKDVLLDLLSARTKPDEGNVYLDGELLLDNPKMSKRLCYISSKPHFQATCQLEVSVGL